MASYAIELTGEAWKAVGELSSDAFGHLRKAINTLAADPALRAAGYDVTDSGRYTPTMQVGEVSLHYSVDHATEKITIHRIQKVREQVA